MILSPDGISVEPLTRSIATRPPVPWSDHLFLEGSTPMSASSLLRSKVLQGSPGGIVVPENQHYAIGPAARVSERADKRCRGLLPGLGRRSPPVNAANLVFGGVTHSPDSSPRRGSQGKQGTMSPPRSGTVFHFQGPHHLDQLSVCSDHRRQPRWLPRASDHRRDHCQLLDVFCRAL